MRRQRNMFQIKEQDKGLRKRTKQREDKQATQQRVQGNNHKDAQQIQNG